MYTSGVSSKRIHRLGDRLPTGRFILYNKFTHAINLHNGNGRLLSLVDEYAGAGPNHIEVEPALLAITREVLFDGESLLINGERFPLDTAFFYYSGLVANSSSP